LLIKKKNQLRQKGKNKQPMGTYMYIELEILLCYIQINPKIYIHTINQIYIFLAYQIFLGHYILIIF